jgi:hypothetical protein
MTEPPDDIRPRWAKKLGRDTNMDPEVRVMFKVLGVLLVVIVIWTVVARI